MIDILDTAGQEEYSCLRDQVRLWRGHCFFAQSWTFLIITLAPPRSPKYMRFGQCFIVMYSITSRSSFEEAQGIRDLIIRIKDREDVPIVLVRHFPRRSSSSTEADRKENALAHLFAFSAPQVGNKFDLEDQREVMREEGLECARRLCIPFLETSAKLRLNIDEVRPHTPPSALISSPEK